MIKVAILDLYEGAANQGMRCIRELVNQWGEQTGDDVRWDEFDVRLKAEVPDLSYDIFISSGGPGSPLDSEGSEWERAYFDWLEKLLLWNNNPEHRRKKSVFFICHSFQLVCRYWGLGEISKRRSTSFGVFPVHVLLEGQHDAVFEGLGDPFYVVDSRDWQVTKPNFETIKKMGAQILGIEKYRPHVLLDQAVMGIRFNEYMVGTQFHPEADAIGMRMYLQTDEKKQTVIENYGHEKWESMIQGLSDPEKIMRTHNLIIPNFLNQAAANLEPMAAVV